MQIACIATKNILGNSAVATSLSQRTISLEIPYSHDCVGNDYRRIQ
jgi:hypothetical protein